MVQKFRKKPVVIEAVKLSITSKSIRECLEFMGQKVNTKSQIASGKFEGYCWDVAKNGLQIKTLEGTMTAKVGDYIIKGVNGEFYPCKPNIFKKTYEKV
jgi:hypothetical protein